MQLCEEVCEKGNWLDNQLFNWKIVVYRNATSSLVVTSLSGQFLLLEKKKNQLFGIYRWGRIPCCKSDVYILDLKNQILNSEEYAHLLRTCEKFIKNVLSLKPFQTPQGFGDILNLVPLAEYVIKLSAVCMNCYNEASFTKKKIVEQVIFYCSLLMLTFNLLL